MGYEEEVGKRVERAALEVTVASLVMSGMGTAAVGERVGLSEGQVRKILARPGVRKYLEGLKERIEEKMVDTAPGVEALRRINTEAAKAVDVLSEIVQDEGEKAANRISAAKVLMSYSTDLRPVKEKDEEKEGAKHLHLHLAPKQVEWMRKAMQVTGNDHVTRMIDRAQGDGGGNGVEGDLAQ